MLSSLLHDFINRNFQILHFFLKIKGGQNGEMLHTLELHMFALTWHKRQKNTNSILTWFSYVFPGKHQR
jgi:hypothetical protein